MRSLNIAGIGSAIAPSWTRSSPVILTFKHSSQRCVALLRQAIVPQLRPVQRDLILAQDEHQAWGGLRERAVAAS